ncbi:maleylacetoacetate isomerase [uncultured Abyssibacter sp.]|uniref:maleylacetoacetate isomerase n=1 Tax=uncultured Abyssibacter sp. TaxID=2320202 RepID=UPI0032B10C31
MQLYSYWRSSSSYRVRIALELKGLDYGIVPVHLVRDGGEQHRDDYRRLNPQGYVPMLVHGPHRITQSMAIIDYLDRVFPEPALTPDDPGKRATVLAFAQTIAADIQPLQNLSVLRYLTETLGHPDPVRVQWSAHWIYKGLRALESVVAEHPRHACCFGDTPGLAEVCLVPQMYNAERFGVDLDALPELVRVTNHCRAMPAFQRAHPDCQPDAE